MQGWPEADDETLLIHNPRCSKSRATLELLESRGVAFEVRRYLDEPLSRAELVELGARLARPVSQWVRTKEASYGEAGLTAESGDDALLDAIARHPELLERPVVVRGRRAEIGRPPERVLDLF
jgi:arsenate reductase